MIQPASPVKNLTGHLSEPDRNLTKAVPQTDISDRADVPPGDREERQPGRADLCSPEKSRQTIAQQGEAGGG